MTAGPCWPVPDPDCCPNWEQADPATRERMARVAASILWMATGRRLGLCPYLARPCGERCGQPTTYEGRRRFRPLLNPALVDGVWVNCGCGCPKACSCCEVCEIWLPGPVASIEEVWWDGELVDPGTYRVDDLGSLVRTEGECWPMCQDLAKPHDAPGAFAVRYLRGWPLDAAAMWAYGRYTCELIKACQGDGSCELPQRVQTITRQGVTMSFEESLANLSDGRTGLPDVDLWIRSVNPYRHASPLTVWSPDINYPRHTTWGRG